MYNKSYFNLRIKIGLCRFYISIPSCHVELDNQSWIFVFPTLPNLSAHRSADTFYSFEMITDALYGDHVRHRTHDDVIKWKHFPRYWPFVRGIQRSPVNSPHKGQWRGALMFSLICVWINGWVNNREAGDLRRHRAHYDVTVRGWNFGSQMWRFCQVCTTLLYLFLVTFYILCVCSKTDNKFSASDIFSPVQCCGHFPLSTIKLHEVVTCK